MFRELPIIVLFCLTLNARADIAYKGNVGYDAEELLAKILFGNVTEPRGVLKFEQQYDANYPLINDQHLRLPITTPLKFEVDQEIKNPSKDSNGLHHTFQPSNGKKKRRRRKPKQHFPRQPGFSYPEHPSSNRPALGPGPSFGQVPGYGPGFGPAPGFEPNYGPNPLHPQFYRPPKRPEPSLASDALAAVTGALTSIAHNDDYQCVARLLCEAAAGGALGGSSLLDSVSGLQPLLTLLSAYNGISSNPLFVFGRAAFLGMSSKGNPGSCRYAYPLCPTDPEQLVHYLNNHNGGFFRFFNAPQHGQQNLEQFYNQLSQNYGLYQPGPGNNQEFYGLTNPEHHQKPGDQQHLYPNGYGYQQNYGFAYPYNQNYDNRIRFNNDNVLNDDRSNVGINDNGNKIEKRIQNKPASFMNNNSVTSSSKWLFPGEDDESEIGVQYINNDDFDFIDNRKSKTLKFPEAGSTYNNDYGHEFSKEPINFYTTEKIRKSKAISFPEKQDYNINDYNTNKYYSPVYSDDNRFYFKNVNKGINNIFKGDNYNNNNYKDYQEEPGVTTVYVVRGNGDPSKPEIVKLRPGETLKGNNHFNMQL